MRCAADPETERITAIAAAAGAPLVIEGDHWHCIRDGDRLAYRDSFGELALASPRMVGTHQVRNAGLATAMLRHQRHVIIGPEALAAAPGAAHWPARLEQLIAGPLTETAPGRTIWVDGCHNPAAATVIAGEVPRLLGDRAHVAVIAGVLANKDAQGILAPFISRAATFRMVGISGHPHHAPQDLAAGLQASGVDAHATTDVPAAIAELAAMPGISAILVIGSLYLAGSVLRANRQFPD